MPGRGGKHVPRRHVRAIRRAARSQPPRAGTRYRLRQPRSPGGHIVPGPCGRYCYAEGGPNAACINQGMVGAANPNAQPRASARARSSVCARSHLAWCAGGSGSGAAGGSLKSCFQTMGPDMAPMPMPVRPCHVCTGIGLAPFTSAPELGSPLATPAFEARLTAAPSAPGLDWTQMPPGLEDAVCVSYSFRCSKDDTMCTPSEQVPRRLRAPILPPPRRPTPPSRLPRARPHAHALTHTPVRARTCRSRAL